MEHVSRRRESLVTMLVLHHLARWYTVVHNLCGSDHLSGRLRSWNVSCRAEDSASHQIYTGHDVRDFVPIDKREVQMTPFSLRIRCPLMRLGLPRLAKAARRVTWLSSVLA